jgi:hypothetical protein
MCYGRHHGLVNNYGISGSQMTSDMFHLSRALLCPFLIHDFERSQRGNQNPQIEEGQTTQSSKEIGQKDKQRSTKLTRKTKD